MKSCFHFWIFLSALLVSIPATTTQMPNSASTVSAITTTPTGQPDERVRLLDEKARKAAASVDEKNSSYVGWMIAATVATVVAALVAGMVVVKQYRVIVASRELSSAQDELMSEKDRIAREDSQRKDSEINEAKKEAGRANEAAGIANEAAGNANERAAKAELVAATANAEAARLNERAASLERDAAAARLELARIDPMNLPIRSIRVELYLLIRGSFIDNSPYAGGDSFNDFVIFDDHGALVHIKCSQGECVPVNLRVGDEPEPSSPNARSFKLAFVWPSIGFFETSAGDNQDLLFPIEKNNTSTAEFEKTVSKARVAISGLKGPPTIEEGYCVITLNGSLQRRFAVSKTVEIPEGIGGDGQIALVILTPKPPIKK